MCSVLHVLLVECWSSRHINSHDDAASFCPSFNLHSNEILAIPANSIAYWCCWASVAAVCWGESLMLSKVKYLVKWIVDYAGPTPSFPKRSWIALAAMITMLMGFHVVLVVFIVRVLSIKYAFAMTNHSLWISSSTKIPCSESWTLIDEPK